ncbi:MAG TPA: sugar ABC transporter permease [Mycobacteriales bacterium]|nr:sugar ABC transporter permease [Mycobacteriales bacterium]
MTEAPPQPPRTRRKRRPRAGRRTAWLLTAPAVVVMLAVGAYPVGYAIWLSLQRYDLRFPSQRGFVGLGNYAAVLGARVFWTDLGATAVITAIAVTAELVLGFAIALTLRRGLAGRRAVHAALLLPYGIITVVAAFAWQYAATPDLSFLSGRAWLGERWSSFAVVIATEVWKTTPLAALLLLAGLAAVPEELMDTAKMDGATAWQRFRRVMLPGIRPVLLVVLLYRTLDSVRVFDTVFIQTNGANGTETVSLLAYDQLAGRLNLGLGSAVSVLLFLLSAAIALGFVWVFRADLRELYRPRPVEPDEPDPEDVW